MRDFRDETERAVWAAAFVRSTWGAWKEDEAERWADYVVDKLRERTKPADPYRTPPNQLEVCNCGYKKGGRSYHEHPDDSLLEDAAKAVRKLAASRPEPSIAGECGDQSRIYYESLAEALDEWKRKLQEPNP